MLRKGLDVKKDLVKHYLEYINTDQIPPEFEPAAAPVAEPAAEPAAEPMTFRKAKEATVGMILRKTPTPRFVGFAAPNIELNDLTVRDWHGRNPVKCLVKITPK